MDLEIIILYFILYLLIEEMEMQHQPRRRVLYLRLGMRHHGQVSSGSFEQSI